MEVGIIASMGVVFTRTLSVLTASAVIGVAATLLPPPPAHAYGDGTAAFCRVTEDRATVSSPDARASIESAVCFYEIQYGAVILYPIIKIQSLIPTTGQLITNCSVGFETLTSSGQVISRDTLVAYGPIFPLYSYYAQKPLYKTNNLAQIRLRSITCSKATAPTGLYSGYGISIGTPIPGQYQTTIPVTFANRTKDEYTLTGEITYRSPSYNIVGIVDIFGEGCTPRNMTLKPQEVKTCYIKHPDYTTNPNFPYTLSDYAYQGTRQVVAPRLLTYPTISGRGKVGSTLTATPATYTGETSSSVAWWSCTSRVRAAGTGEPPPQCKSLGSATGTSYRLKKTDVGKFLIVKNYGSHMTGSLNAYSRSIGPIRR